MSREVKVALISAAALVLASLITAGVVLRPRGGDLPPDVSTSTSATGGSYVSPLPSPKPPRIDEFLVQAGGGVNAITAGPDGNMWFTMTSAGKIGRITPQGQLLPFFTANDPGDITVGPDGSLWFGEYYQNRIGRITRQGTVSEYPIAKPRSRPNALTSCGGSVWFTENFTENQNSGIGEITMKGEIREYTVPTRSTLNGIVCGRDGNIWFGETAGKRIGRITSSGKVTEFPVSGTPYWGIANGPDGNIWFTEHDSSRIGKITLSGAATEFATATADSGPVSIASGPDGNLWYLEAKANAVAYATPAGESTELSIPTPASGAWYIVAGHGNTLWFVESAAGKLGRITLNV